MGDDSFGEVNGDERHILDAVQVLLPCGHHQLGLFLNHVVHDRQIVGCQIPDDVHIVLEQPQVYAERIVIVEIPERPFIHQLANLFHRAGEEEGVVHHNLQILAIG